MRVLQVSPTIAPSAGSPATITTFAAHLVTHGVETTVVTTTDGGSEVPLRQPIVCNGVTYIFHEVAPLGRRWRLAPSIVPTLRRVIGTSDLVHIHWLYDFSSLAAARVALTAGTPFVIQPRGSLDPFLRRRNRVLKSLYLATVGRPLLSRAAAVIFTAEEERRLASYARQAPEWVVPVGVDVARFDRLPAPGMFRAAFPEVAGPFLLFLGRLSPQKGIDLLLRAFHMLSGQRRDLWLVLAGPDYRGYEGRLRRMARDLGIEARTVFTGLLGHDLKVAAFVDAELLVLPSYAENFGVVIAEALACGLPVVISDRVNIHQELADAGAAQIVRCTAEDVRTGIESLLADATARRRIADIGPALVRSHYSWDIIVPRLIARYRELL